jgi:dienelactone hydrolase
MPPSIEPNPLGNQAPFLKTLERETNFSLSFLRDEFGDFNTWAPIARQKLLDSLLYSPTPVAPDAGVVETVDMGDYIREKVFFNTTPHVRVPAYVLVPKEAKFPAPAIVALHDHGAMYYWGKEKIVATEADSNPVLAEFKEVSYGGRSFTTDLVRQGYVVIAIDMFYWGERRTDFREVPHLAGRLTADSGTPEEAKQHNRLAAENVEFLARAIFLTGHTWAGIMFWDDVRTVDYLLTRPEVDPDRIGCVGLSVGGFRSDHLVTLDSRIKAAGVVGWMTAYEDCFPNHIYNTVGWMKMIPGIHKYLDLPDMMALAVPRPLMIMDGLQDGLFPRSGVERAYEKIGRAYAKAGFPNRFATRTYDRPHEFNREMQDEMWKWLNRWLQP